MRHLEIYYDVDVFKVGAGSTPEKFRCASVVSKDGCLHLGRVELWAGLSRGPGGSTIIIPHSQIDMVELKEMTR